MDWVWKSILLYFIDIFSDFLFLCAECRYRKYITNENIKSWTKVDLLILTFKEYCKNYLTNHELWIMLDTFMSFFHVKHRKWMVRSANLFGANIDFVKFVGNVSRVLFIFDCFSAIWDNESAFCVKSCNKLFGISSELVLCNCNNVVQLTLNIYKLLQK